jgi:hypothetical protein
MRLLLIGLEEKNEINKVIDFAKKHPITQQQLTTTIVGDIPDYVCSITEGFRIVFSFEHQPVGWCRHISISVSDPNKLPSILAVEMIIKEFGFSDNISDQENVWIENEILPNAINVVSKIKTEELELFK